MHIIKRIILICCISAFCLEASAIEQFYYFKHYTSEEGTPNNTITCAIQDHFGFIWFGTKDGICRYNGHNFTVLEAPELNSCINGMTFSLCEDQDGMLWCCTTNGTGFYNLYTGEVTRVEELNGIRFVDINVDKYNNIWFVSSNSIYKLDRNTGKYIRYASDRHFSALHSCIDTEGNIWFSTIQGDIRRYNPDSDYFEVFPLNTEKLNIPGTYPVYLKAIDATRLLISTNKNDLIRIDVKNGTREFLTHIDEPITGLLPRTETEYWIGTSDGLSIYDDVRKISAFISNGSDYELSNSNVTCMLEDNEGNMWLGTYYGGLNLWFSRDNSFTKIFYTGTPGTFYGKLVHPIMTDDNGNMWVGTEDGCLNQMILDKRQVIGHSQKNGFPSRLNIHGLLQEKNMLWIATFNDGIYLFNLDTQKITGHKILPSNQCVCIIRTKDGTILVGTTSGLYRYDPANDSFELVPGPGRRFIHTLYQDSYGTIWVGTYGSGIFYSKDSMHSFESISSGDAKYGLKSGYITYFYEDAAHILWIATEGGGICHTSLKGEISFKHITRNDGMPSNIACAITQDQKGKLWVSTTKGLATLDPKTGSVLKIYQDNYGIVGNQFSYGSCYQFATGHLCFGTTNGMIYFNPITLKDPLATSPLFIQDIRTGKKDNLKETNTSGKSTIMADKIRIKQKDAAYLSISFSALNYSNLSAPQYEYSLSKGRQTSIKTVTKDNSVVFADMRPGHYRFDVKVLGSESPDSQKSLSISVIPPFYNTIMAYVIYLMILLAIAGFFILLVFRKRKVEENSRLDQMEALKQKEIADAKINFFTNITHEIRTPLSLIKMPIEKIVAQQEYTEASREDIMTIKSNTNRLLELTNQLLDIRKMEQNQVAVHFLMDDICAIVKKTCDYFSKAAEEQHITYKVNIPDQPIQMLCSSDIIKKIVSNLMSNAVKYCTSSIELTLSISEDQKNVIIRVNSDGNLIKNDDREKIFTPFYQVKSATVQLKGSNGTGLGLPYARTLANLHKGTLAMDTDVKDLNSFVLTLPLTQPAILNTQDESQETAEEIITDTDADTNRHSILVVEDAPEMRHYLSKELSPEYNIFVASNGEEALGVIKEQKIDLVVSDIMMPVMDGCQLCNNIKNDVEYSHIPVILLTAAVGVETRIETLEVGADGYIEKPFAIELLKANILNLFKNREIAYRQFANSPLSHFNSVSFNNIEKAFMDKLHATIMKHMSEQDLGIDTLTTLLGTSKSTLYRKIKANTGLNTNEYIRLCRLKKAAEMLSTQEHRINEVAYLVGFSSPSYFTTSFQKQFNISPSAFVKNLQA